MNLSTSQVEILLLNGFGGLGPLFILECWPVWYRKGEPHEALIIYGMGGHPALSRAAAQYRTGDRELPGPVAGADVVRTVAPKQDMYTKQGVAVTVEAVAQIKVKFDNELHRDRAPSSFLTRARRNGRADSGW